MSVIKWNVAPLETAMHYITLRYHHSTSHSHLKSVKVAQASTMLSLAYSSYKWLTVAYLGFHKGGGDATDDWWSWVVNRWVLQLLSKAPVYWWVPEARSWKENYLSNCYIVCSGSVVVTAYDFESGRPGSNPELGPIYYKASITAQGLPEPSSLLGSTLGTRAAEHKICNWGVQIDWWLQPRAVFGHTFSGIIWHMPQK